MVTDNSLGTSSTLNHQMVTFGRCCSEQSTLGSTMLRDKVRRALKPLEAVLSFTGKVACLSSLAFVVSKRVQHGLAFVWKSEVILLEISPLASGKHFFPREIVHKGRPRSRGKSDFEL